MNQKQNLTKSVLVALFAALIASSCFIQLPLPGGVPIAIQDMMAILSGLLLGATGGFFSVLIFLILGCIGLPVFTGKAGFYVIFSSPTGGFLVGYLVSAFFAGFFMNLFFALGKKKHFSSIYTWFVIIFVSTLAMVIEFIFGVSGFVRIMNVSVNKAFFVVILPFLPGTFIKIVFMSILTKRFKPIIDNYLG